MVSASFSILPQFALGAGFYCRKQARTSALPQSSSAAAWNEQFPSSPWCDIGFFPWPSSESSVSTGPSCSVYHPRTSEGLFLVFEDFSVLFPPFLYVINQWNIPKNKVYVSCHATCYVGLQIVDFQFSTIDLAWVCDFFQITDMWLRLYFTEKVLSHVSYSTLESVIIITIVMIIMVCVCVCVHVLLCTWGGQKVMCISQLFPSTIWGTGDRIWVFMLDTKHSLYWTISLALRYL